MNFIGRNKLYITLFFIVVSITFFTECINRNQREPVIVNNLGEQFAGSVKCAACHKEINENFTHTAHNITSQAASENTIKGSFADGKNVFQYSYFISIAMQKTESGFYQVLYDHYKEKTARRIDIVVGSGARGQTFGTWDSNRIYQLPVSYLTSADAWCNSPGYTSFEPVFTRRITARCLDCHGTYFKDISTPKNPQEFDNQQIIYGVQCERCHGPGEKHIEFQQQNPEETKARYIINPASFSRQQKLDMCSYCHNNKSRSPLPAFEFAIGDSLVNPVQATSINIDSQSIDVHGNQYGLLIASKCFKMSGSMDCSSCHNTHKEERGNLELFSQRCMVCHTEAKGNFCKMTDLPISVLKTDCIDCHMPKKQSKVLTLELVGKTANTPATLRSHLIAVYPGESKKHISLSKSTGVNK